MLLYALIEGEHFQSYYIFYGVAVLRAASTCRRSAGCSSGVSGLDPARRRLPPPRGARRLRARTSRPSRTRCATAREIEPVRLRLAHAVGLPNGLRDFRSLEQLERHFDAIDEVLIADPDFPQERGRRAGRPLPPARRARARRAVDDGDPDGPRRVRARPGAAAVRAEAAGLRGRRLRDQAHLRPRRRRAAGARALAADAARRARDQAQLARPGASTARSARASAASRSPASSSARWSPAPSSSRTARGAERGGRRALQDPRATRA